MRLSGLTFVVLTARIRATENFFKKLCYLILASDCPLCVFSSSGFLRTISKKPESRDLKLVTSSKYLIAWDRLDS